MPEYNALEKIETLKSYINSCSTGNSFKLSEKLEVSRSTLFNYLSYIRGKGYVIKYSRLRETYFFE